jgi:hypothetical protein
LEQRENRALQHLYRHLRRQNVLIIDEPGYETVYKKSVKALAASAKIVASQTNYCLKHE